MSRRGLEDIPQGERMNFDLDKARATSPIDAGFDKVRRSVPDPVIYGIIYGIMALLAIAFIIDTASDFLPLS